MNCTAKKMSLTFKKGDTVLLFLDEQAATIKSIPHEFSYIVKSLDISFFKGKQSETMFAPYIDRPAVILCGTGKKEEIDSESLRRSAAAAAGLCREKSIVHLHVIIQDDIGTGSETALAAIAEGLYLANYSFDKYKTKANGNCRTPIAGADFYTNAKNPASILKRVSVISRNTLLCRDLVNELSDECDSLRIAREAKMLEKLSGITCTIYDKKVIEKMKMGLLLAVNRGSAKPPRLVVLTYTGAPRNSKFFAIVGKGITFDSGGLNLKSSGNIEDMRTDMAGAAVAMYVVKSAAELKLPVNLYAVMPVTDNMLTNASYRPGDVYTAGNGTTVEIGNTDAEGRLILADALIFTEKRLKPEIIIDIATLTGACLATFGEHAAAYMTTDENLGKLLADAGVETGEIVWPLPLLKDYEDNLKSDIADISNMSSEKNSGTIIGGTFLKNFVKTKRWAHIDIASTARNTKQRGYRPKEATGFGVRLLVEAISKWNGR